ncbi:MAG: isoprenylcysteine carboxylmethyltransferase family protein [Candidatus Lokiarchaeia archaeon]|nr:isoprenylcysteine carboxylmethyltransferase family protein [Candidatus Lokiarchaeia archaeon]
MELFPTLSIGWVNGWIFQVIFFTSFGIFLLTCSKDVISRLYDEKGWNKLQKAFTKITKLFGLIALILFIFTPLNIGSIEFFIGIILIIAGTIGFLIALNNFKNSELNKPINTGLYKISRNPQLVMMYLTTLGNCLTIGSWTTLIIFILSILSGHFRILGEEKRLTEQYGDSYLEYKKKVPRYFIFF